MPKAEVGHCREMAIVGGGFVDIAAWSLDAVAAAAHLVCAFGPCLVFAGAVYEGMSPGAPGVGHFIVGVVLTNFGRTSLAVMLQV